MPAFSSAQLAAIETRAYYSCDLIEMDFTAAISTLYICTASADLTLTTDTGSHTFVGGKNGLMTTPSIAGTVNNSKTTVDIMLSAQNLLYVATVQDGSFMNTDVRIYKCIFSSDTADSNTGLTIIDSPVQMFKGQIKGAQYNAGINEATVTFNCDHWLFDNKTVNQVRTNPSLYSNWVKDKYNSQYNTGWPLNYEPPEDRTPFGQRVVEVRWGMK